MFFSILSKNFQLYYSKTFPLHFVYLYIQTTTDIYNFFSAHNYNARNPISCWEIFLFFTSWESIGLEEINEDENTLSLFFLFHPQGKILPSAMFRALITFFGHLTPLYVARFFSFHYFAKNNIKVHYKEHKFICPSVFSLQQRNRVEFESKLSSEPSVFFNALFNITINETQVPWWGILNWAHVWFRPKKNQHNFMIFHSFEKFLWVFFQLKVMLRGLCG